MLRERPARRWRARCIHNLQVPLLEGSSCIPRGHLTRHQIMVSPWFCSDGCKEGFHPLYPADLLSLGTCTKRRTNLAPPDVCSTRGTNGTGSPAHPGPDGEQDACAPHGGLIAPGRRRQRTKKFAIADVTVREYVAKISGRASLPPRLRLRSIGMVCASVSRQ